MSHGVGEWAEARLETTYENACGVLEAQRETVAKIDEKACYGRSD